MRPNNICCIVVGDDNVGPACYVIAYKCPEIRVTILRKNFQYQKQIDPEVDLEKIIKKCLNRNLFFSSDYATVIREADLIFLSINDSSKETGLTGGNAINMKQLEEAVKLIVQHTDSDRIIVENSRIPVKAAERIANMLPTPPRSQVRFHVISNPEFLNEGSSLDELLNPERVLIGCQNKPASRAAAEALCEFYEQWIPRKNILILSERSTELCKLVGSAFLAQHICNMHCLSELSERTHTNFSEVSEIVARSSKVGSKFLQTSAGFGLFRKEILSLISLCKSLNLTEAASYWQAVIDMDEYQKIRCFKKIESILGSLSGKDIAIWGFPCVKSTSDTKNTPVIEVCQWLLEEDCKLKIYDTYVSDEKILKVLGIKSEDQSERNVKICTNAYEACANASAVIICKDWDEFKNIDYSRVAKEMLIPVIIEGKKILNEETLKDFGINLYSVPLSYIYT